jgi:hypothetical protein
VYQSVVEKPEYWTASSLELGINQLLDEVFAEVERLLAPDTPIAEPPSPAATTSAAIQPLLPQSFVLPPRLTTRDRVPQPEAPLPDGSTSLQRVSDPSSALLAKPQGDELVAIAADSPPPVTAGKSIDRVLVAAILASLAASGGLGWFYSTQLDQPSEPSSTTALASPTLTERQTQENIHFLNYLKQALDRLTEAEQQAIPAQKANFTAVLPSPRLLQPAAKPLLSTSRRGNSHSSTAAPTPTSLAPNPDSKSSPERAAIANAPAPTTYALIGVLELGDRSAALFMVAGNPQRVQVGKPIGSSGWTLVAVAKQQAIVRRDREVRSIFVGQGF